MFCLGLGQGCVGMLGRIVFGLRRSLCTRRSLGSEGARFIRVAPHRGMSGLSSSEPNGQKKPLVYVGMSGGVDSSVAALLMVKKGFHVEGVYMKNWDSSDEVGEQTCPIDQDLMDVKAVCDKIGIKYHMVDFVKDYWNDVFDRLLRDYAKGITPNPDVFCNSRIKFNKFLQYALNKGADYIATGLEEREQ